MFTSISLYRNAAIPLTVPLGKPWGAAGNAASSSFVPFWGHLFKEQRDLTGKRTRVTACWSIEWDKGSGDGGVRLCVIEGGQMREVASVTEDQHAQFNPETGGAWISHVFQDLIDRGVNCGLVMELRDGVRVYGSHLCLFYWQEGG